MASTKQRQDGYWIVQFGDDEREVVLLKDDEVWATGSDMPFDASYKDIKWIRRVEVND